MQIETNVPIPESSQSKYPFRSMEPGQSVFIEGQGIKGNAYKAALMMGKYKGWKFTGRTVDGGLRIWRIE